MEYCFRNAGASALDLTLVNALNGDRIVIELGIISVNTSTTEYTGTIRIGDNGASDLPENETETDTTMNPWLEFDTVNLRFSAEATSWIPKVIFI